MFRDNQYLFSHIQESWHTQQHSPSVIRRHILNVSHNRQEDSSIFSFSAYLSTLHFRHIKSYSQRQTYWVKLAHIRVYFHRFRNIQNTDAVRLIHVYYGILRTHDLFRHIQNCRYISSLLCTLFRYSRAIYVHSERYLGRLMHIQSPSLLRHLMFHANSGIFPKLHILRNMCPHLDMFQEIQIYSGSLHYRPKQCEPTPAHLLFKSGSSFKSLFKYIWINFSLLFQK